MKTFATTLGLLIAVSAAAQDSARATLIGQRVVAYPGSPILVCRYRSADAQYEVVAASGTCAPYLVLSKT